MLKILTIEYSKHPETNMELAVSGMIKHTKSGHEGAQRLRIVRDHFEIQGPEGRHDVLVYEPMREPLTTLQQRFANDRISERVLKSIIQFVLEGLDFLHSECHIIHTGQCYSIARRPR